MQKVSTFCFILLLYFGKLCEFHLFYCVYIIKIIALIIIYIFCQLLSIYHGNNHELSYEFIFELNNICRIYANRMY